MRDVSARFGVATLVVWTGCSTSTGTFDSPSDPILDAAAEVSTDAMADGEAVGPGDAETEGSATDVYPDMDNDGMDLEAAAGDGTLLERSYVGPEGTRDYLLYEPAGYDGTPRALVVALHGCSQSASHFATASGYNRLADQHGFIVVWPEQSLLANTALCWNWFLPGHQRRDVGEAAVIAAIVGEVGKTHALDPKRIHAVGMSAGAAMAVVLGAVFPDVFASIGSVEGCPFQGTPCVGSASVLPAATLATYVVSAMGARTRPVPLFAIQGSLDINVPPANGDLLVKQWVLAADVVDDNLSNQSISSFPHHVSDDSAHGYSFRRSVYVDGAGKDFIEYLEVKGLGHAWPGASVSLAFSDTQGPSATEGSWHFLEAHPMP